MTIEEYAKIIQKVALHVKDVREQLSRLDDHIKYLPKKSMIWADIDEPGIRVPGSQEGTIATLRRCEARVRISRGLIRAQLANELKEAEKRLAFLAAYNPLDSQGQPPGQG